MRFESAWLLLLIESTCMSIAYQQAILILNGIVSFCLPSSLLLKQISGACKYFRFFVHWVIRQLLHTRARLWYQRGRSARPCNCIEVSVSFLLAVWYNHFKHTIPIVLWLWTDSFRLGRLACQMARHGPRPIGHHKSRLSLMLQRIHLFNC